MCYTIVTIIAITAYSLYPLCWGRMSGVEPGAAVRGALFWWGSECPVPPDNVLWATGWSAFVTTVKSQRNTRDQSINQLVSR